MELLSTVFIVLAYIAAIGFFVFGLDDIIFDFQFIRHSWRTRHDKHTRLDELRAKPEQHIAIFVPAWSEGGIVNRMADYAVKILEYERYDIFIGVYPNDPETVACVEALEKICPRIHKAMCPNPGPTSKADCLNAIYKAMRMREIPGLREYGIIALHDSEDVLHPLTLKIYNYFVPSTFDMGQIPVFPLELSPLKQWIGACYMDEFTELHLKDMLARQEIGGIVPSAGVGTAFARDAVDWLADHNGGDPFVVGNLTEDYFLGIQLKRAGYRTGFINYPIDRLVVDRNDDGKIVSRRYVTEIVAVRENFPMHFWAAVRQRSRWILGISMQCWELAGWEGSLPVRYTLVRDRRAPLVHLINFIGYVVILSWLIEMIFRSLPIVATSYWRPLFTPDSFLWTLILVDTCFLVYRVLIKVFYVKQIYGWKQALFSIPRYPLGNVINFFATCRATWMYVRSRVFGKPLVWIKTTHLFPTTTDLTEFVASVEDLLLQGGKVPRSRIEQLLHNDAAGSVPSKLLQLRLIDEEEFTTLWARFSSIPEKTVTTEDADPRVLELMPEEEAIANGLVSVAEGDDGHLEVAFTEPPSQMVRQDIEARYGRPLSACLITPTNLRILRERLYSRRAMPRYRRDLSGALADRDPARWREVREIQFRTGRRASDLFINLGYVGADTIRALWGEIYDAEPCSIADEKLDQEALEALGPLFCDLHRLAPLQGGKLVFQDCIHPETMKVIEERLGRCPRPVIDVALPVRNFLRGVFGRINPEQMLVDRMVAEGSLSASDAADLAALKTLVRTPVHMLVEKLGIADAGSVSRAYAAMSRLPEPAGDFSAPVARGILRPDFEEATGARILEARDGLVTIGLRNPLRPEDFSEICTRLLLCAVRFVLMPANP